MIKLKKECNKKFQILRMQKKKIMINLGWCNLNFKNKLN